MTEHTPGPWTCRNQNNWPLVMGPPHTGTVARANGRTDEEAEANQRLIAAAPEMRGELKTTLELLDKIAVAIAVDPSSLFASGVGLEAIDERRGAISKLLESATNTTV